MFIFIIGLCIGSFINVIVYRFPLQLDFIKGRSFCPNCKHQLSYVDLIPLLSFVLLKGRCRYCHKKISLRYPFIELLSGIIAVLCYFCSYTILDFLYVFTISMILLIISLIDIDHMLIYDESLLVLLFMTIISLMIYNISLLERIIGIFIISLPMYLFNYFIESFGGGDIKLISICGFMLGYKSLLISMYITFIIAGIYAFLLYIFKNKNRNEYIPFAPFINIGIFLTLLYYKEIISLFFIPFSF